MGNKYSKQELKHWCDNCCCIDCRQTKKEKLECKRKRNPIKVRIVEMDDEILFKFGSKDEEPIVEFDSNKFFKRHIKELNNRYGNK